MDPLFAKDEVSRSTLQTSARSTPKTPHFWTWSFPEKDFNSPRLLAKSGVIWELLEISGLSLIFLTELLVEHLNTASKGSAW